MARHLAKYHQKRDPDRTPEPMGGRTKKTSRSAKEGPLVFVVQEHHARALHWDLRLERDGVLVSWALPKGLPTDPKLNHLAVHTEDHPLDYEDFEGDIPRGEYGGGQVSIWDRGTYETEKWREDEVMVTLHGSRVSGRYVLFHTGKDGDGKNWMIHRMDPPPEGYEPMPEQVRAMLATSGTLPKNDAGWAYEFKWDGVRAIAFVDGGRVRATSRNDNDLTSSFPELRDVGLFLGSTRAVLDGELVAFDDDGRPSFGRLQQRLHLNSPSGVARAASRFPASFLAFDLLYLDGSSLFERTYDERRALLEGLNLQGETFATPPSVNDRSGKELLALSRERGFEGVVAKRRDSRYAQGQRNGQWIKIKNFRTQEVVIGGWTDGRGERSGSLGALLLGLPGEKGLDYVGKVGTGFSEAVRRQLFDVLTPLARNSTPFNEGLTRADALRAHFVHPELVAEVRYGEWTSDGRLRHPVWGGLRPDKEPADVTREP